MNFFNSLNLIYLIDTQFIYFSQICMIIYQVFFCKIFHHILVFKFTSIKLFLKFCKDWKKSPLYLQLYPVTILFFFSSFVMNLTILLAFQKISFEFVVFLYFILIFNTISFLQFFLEYLKFTFSLQVSICVYVCQCIYPCKYCCSCFLQVLCAIISASVF